LYVEKRINQRNLKITFTFLPFYCRSLASATRMSATDVRAAVAAVNRAEAANIRPRTRELSNIDPKFTSQVGLFAIFFERSVLYERNYSQMHD